MSTTSTTDASTAPRNTRRWWGLAAAAVLWLTIYQLNLRWWNWVVFDVFGLDPDTRLAGSVHFFFYDVTKITLLLVGVIFLVTVLRSFMSVERTRSLLGGRREGIGNVAAAGLGVITPFCSCSAVPLFIGFVESGLPLGVTFSYLVAAPLINEVALVMLFGMFGWRIAGLYLLSGLTIAIVSGIVIGRLGMERYVEDFV